MPLIRRASFCVGGIVYQAKWGVVISIIHFSLDWDGEEDSIAKDITINNIPVVLEEKSLQDLENIIIDLDSINNYIREWDKSRENEISSFIERANR